MKPVKLERSELTTKCEVKSRRIYDREGSYTVFVVLVFTALLIGVGAVLSASGKLAISSASENFGRLWGTSILAEYDLNLKDRYGIFAFYGNEAMVESKLDRYAMYTFKDKNYVDYSGCECDLAEFCLQNEEVFKRQVEEAAVFQIKPMELKRNEGAEETSSESYGNREITSQWIIESLPSKNVKTSVSVSKITEEIRQGEELSHLVGNSLINTYVFTYFKDNCNERSLGETYFQNEVEYILSGRTSDSAALKNVKTKLSLIRNGLNLIYLYSSEEKREAAMALASVMTPGPEAVATQAVLLETWAYAEAQNDTRLLLAGKEVPLLKKNENWALSLDNAVNFQDVFENGYMEPERLEGCTYDEYLRIMLNLLPEKIKLLRIMDLIQINMKYLYCDYFLIADYYAGLKFSMKVNGVSHEFEETYERSSE